ncbi:MAG: hypothetical protein ACYDCL_01100 [Myxococcales bacterium]
MFRTAPLLIAVAALLGGANGGCGALSPAEVNAPSATGSSVFRWIGVDPRPLAVGTQATVSFEVAAGGDCCAQGFTATSTAPSIIAVSSGLLNQTLQLQALAPGAAAIQVTAPDGTLQGELPLTAEAPASIVFADPSHLAAAIEGDTALPATFSLLQGGYAIIQAVIEDAAGNPLASQGLASCESPSGLWVTKEEPEKVTVTALPGAAQGALVCGLSADPTTDIRFEVHLVDGAETAALETRTAQDGSVVVLAKGLDANFVETLGLGQWIFSLVGPQGTTAQRLADAAEKVAFPPNTAAASAVLTATNGTLAAASAIP